MAGEEGASGSLGRLGCGGRSILSAMPEPPAENVAFDRAKAGRRPPGTRDVYPVDMLRRRYLMESWRAVSVRHGFEEIDGPTFEHSDLYAVKSGEGILGELFQAYSGKDAAEVAEVMRTGRGPYALRPEFTPTLARMYAARAKQLAKPTRWFCIPQFFRAERPQRGRLREFLQWNVDVVGDGSVEADADVFAIVVDALRAFNIRPSVARVCVGNRGHVEHLLSKESIPEAAWPEWFALIDKLEKLSPDEFAAHASSVGFERETVERVRRVLTSDDFFDPFAEELATASPTTALGHRMQKLGRAAVVQGSSEYFRYRRTIVRGLAYYTGTVFELIAEGERAVAGGGRYDKLIELMGGPPTPAVGFAMGDVVLSLLLHDHGLMPGGGEADSTAGVDVGELMDAVQRVQSSYSLRPDAFVVPNGDEGNEELVTPLVARLRRGAESARYLDREDRKPWHADRYEPSAGGVAPLHARTTSKSTRNLKKLLADATAQHARFAVVIHGADKVQLKDLDAREDLAHPTRGDFSTEPGVENDVVRAIAERLGR